MVMVGVVQAPCIKVPKRDERGLKLREAENLLHQNFDLVLLLRATGKVTSPASSRTTIRYVLLLFPADLHINRVKLCRICERVREACYRDRKQVHCITVV